MSPMIGKVGPIRTAKTPKRVRFAGEDREQTRLIRQQEAQKRDARSLPRVDVSIRRSFEFPLHVFLLFFSVVFFFLQLRTLQRKISTPPAKWDNIMGRAVIMMLTRYLSIIG